MGGGEFWKVLSGIIFLFFSRRILRVSDIGIDRDTEFVNSRTGKNISRGAPGILDYFSSPLIDLAGIN